MENDIPKQISCPVCASPAHYSFSKEGYQLYVCSSCGLLFVSLTEPSAAAEIYSEDYFAGAGDGFGYADYDADKQPMIPAFKEYLKRIQEFHIVKGRLLDVGAATGFFLEIARDAGFEVSGVEISDYAASLGRLKGLNVMTGVLADVEEKERAGFFDVITMFDVIEHVTDPEKELQRTQSLLTEGGLLVINTPDKRSWYAQLMGKNWHLIVPPEHLFYFNRKNMGMLLERNGFEVVHVSTIGKQFTPPYVFKTLAAWQKLGIWRWLFEHTQEGFFSRISMPINLGDNMFVIARKTHEK